MSDNSKIEWCDASWNPVRGCTKVSPGCARCYAETFAERFRGVPGHPYEQGFDLRLVPEKLTEPLTWKKPRRVFVNSMSDLFQDGVPDDYIDQVFAVMAWTPRHTYQVLTKRAERLRAYFAEPWYRRVFARYVELRESGVTTIPPGYDDQYALGRSIGAITCGDHASRVLPNVWLGVSVENQHFADERIPLLLQTPAAVRFISAEPLLEHIDLTNFLWTIPGARLNHLHWIIVGGESGPGARPFDLAWARWLIAQGRSSTVPVFVKQLGARVRVSGDAQDALGSMLGAHRMERMRECDGDWRVVYRHTKGGDIDEWPHDLRVREWPSAASAAR